MEITFASEFMVRLEERLMFEFGSFAAWLTDCLRRVVSRFEDCIVALQCYLPIRLFPVYGSRRILWASNDGFSNRNGLA